MGKRSRGCFKNGCFGCLGLIALIVLVFIALAALQLSARNVAPEPVAVEHVHRLSPEATDGGTAGNDASLPLEAGGAMNDGEQLGEVLSLPEKIVTPEPRPGRLILDLSYGEFELRRGEPGEALKVEADYDAGSFELVETFTEEKDGSWSYLVSLDNKGGLFGLLVGGQKKVDNRVIITIPPDHPVDIVGEMGLGELEADLGGLWVRNIDLEFGAGDQNLNFSEPTREPIQQVKIEGSVGQLCLENLGNASPQKVFFEHSIGDGHLDLRGAWLNDADIHASFSIGEMRLELPDNANVIMANQNISVGEVNKRGLERPELPEGAPELTLSIAGSIGEIRLE